MVGTYGETNYQMILKSHPMNKKEAKVIISLEGDKLYMYSYHGGGTRGAVSSKVDVTPVFEFAKDVLVTSKGKK